MQAPDLLNGYLVNTFESFNRFQTDVECALLTTEADGRERFAYLSSLCRPESISPSEIFNEMIYSFAMVTTEQGVFALRSGSSLISRNPFHPQRPDSFFQTTQHKTHIVCPNVEVHEYSFDELLSYLQGEAPGKNNHIYMRIEWQEGSRLRRLFTHCRYINFPNPERDHAQMWDEKPNYPMHELRYIQPITGIVVYEENNIFVSAYVAAHVTAQGTARVEFCLRDSLSFFDLQRHERGRKRKIEQFLSRTVLGRYFSVDDFHRRISVPATCTFYRYS
ncbi:MAG: hypothetical protein EPN26_04780 [Rhodospirillales bacterium]|nr:MAG: hypothetical protein EPN26_04780 [Rhodospirillales bacterium]